MSIIQKLKKNNKLTIQQPYISNELIYEVIMGSFAYGVSSNTSDIDVYGVCIPPKEIVFPHTVGHIKGFGPAPENFESAQQHHIMLDEKEYDVSVYSIVNYFKLCADNNPNIIDSLFVPTRCITHISPVGEILRENRKLFLSKHAFQRFKGYAYQQLKKIKTKEPVGKRLELVEKYGYDVKFAYHLVRLTNECEQILMEGDLNLEQSKEQLKAIRSGSMTMPELEDWFKAKELSLSDLYVKSDLRYAPDLNKLKNILLACLEQHYGSLGNAISNDESIKALSKLEQIRKICDI